MAAPGKSRKSPLVAGYKAGARPTAPTAAKLAATSPSVEEEREAPKATVLIRGGTGPGPESVAAIAAAEGPGPSEPAVPTAAMAPGTPVEPPVETRTGPAGPTLPPAVGDGNGTGEVVGPAVTASPVEPSVPEGPPVAPRGPLGLTGPLAADVVAEDLPPVTLGRSGVQLHHVLLAPAVEPAALQPLWALKAPDGRFWPVGMPKQLYLHAGPDPDPSPADLFVYSDHVDGIMPLHEVSRREVLLTAAQENNAALLHMSREVYDHRRAAWQKRPAGWSIMWYARQVDLKEGETVVACLSELKRSRRAPADVPVEAAESVMLLDETGNRVEPGEMTAEIALQVAATLDEEGANTVVDDSASVMAQMARRGMVGFATWRAPATGRYQVWCALGVDKCAARCLVWMTGK